MRRQSGLGRVDPAPNYDDGRLRLRPADYIAAADGHVLPLTVRELGLLAELARHEGRVVTREDLLKTVWGDDDSITGRAVDTSITRLRAKLAFALPDRAYIHTHIGIGYRFGFESIRPTEDAPKPESQRGRRTKAEQ